MLCPHCQHENAPEAAACAHCGVALAGPDADTVRMTLPPTIVFSGAAQPSPHRDVSALPPGTLLCNRYELISRLGRGGMGTVYRALDRDLDRVIAVKLINPEEARNPDAVLRFKQEILLTRRINHRNVIRVHDLAMDGELRFITMDYIEGRDVTSLFAGGQRPSVEETLDLGIQVARGLEAAHAEGVVHRDLKPENIMVDAQGRVYVLDFGIARSAEMPSLTMTGFLVGTPEYMAPEQALGKTADARSDLYALGLVLYLMLTGQKAYPAESTISSLVRRTQEAARPAIELNPALPPRLNAIVMRCLATNPDERPQSATELIGELERWREPYVVPKQPPAWRGLLAKPKPGPALAVAATVVLALGGWLALRPAARSAGPPKPVTVLVADFANGTGDPNFDSTLEPVFTLAIEGAPFINSYPRNQARRVAGQLRSGATVLDASMSQLVAQREGINVMVLGEVKRKGDRYSILIRPTDASTGKTILVQEQDASKAEVLGAVTRLAANLRNALGDTTPVSAQVAAAETFTASSLEAAHAYAEAQEQQFAGKWQAASMLYEQAVRLDPRMGRAYAGLAMVAFNLGEPHVAQQQFERAMANIDRMSDREKLRTRGSYYLITRDYQKAIEELKSLLERYPGDTSRANLALAYLYARDLPMAIQEGRRYVEQFPAAVPQRNNLALYALYGGQYEMAQREAKLALERQPTFAKAQHTIALAQAAGGNLAQATSSYGTLRAVDRQGQSLAEAGLADLALLEGRVRDADALLVPAIEHDLANGLKESAAVKQVMRAQCRLWLRQPAGPLLDQALQNGQSEGVLLPAGLLLVEMGQPSRAEEIAATLRNRLGAEPQAYARLLEGEMSRRRGALPQAITQFQEAQRLLDTWLGRFHLGRALAESGKFAEAHAELDHCLQRRGEAAAVFLDEWPTLRLVPVAQYWVGRALEGLRSPGARDAYQAFLAVKANDDRIDPLVADARARVAR